MQRSITVLTDVKDLSELLNGARVEDVRSVSAGGQSQIVATLTRAMVELQRVVPAGLFKRVKMPWTKCQLTIGQVKSASVRQATYPASAQLPILWGDAVKGGYQLILRVDEASEWVLEVPTLDGAFTDIGSPIDAP